MNTKSYLIFLIQCLLFVSVLCMAPSQAEEADIFSGLKIGDRVEVTLKNDRAFRGEIKALIPDRITLDISYDDPSLKGTISFFREAIERIAILTPLTQAEKKRELIRKRKELEKYRKETVKYKPVLPKVKKEETIPSIPEKSKGKKEQERLLELLDRFPAEAGWNEERRTDILEKNPTFRTSKEEDFLKIYDDWTKAVELKTYLERRALLEKFPPEKKWGEEKYQELSTRFIRIGVVLNAEEKEFVDKFKDWQKALEELKAEEEAARKAKEETERTAEEKAAPKAKWKQPSPPSQPGETKQ